MAKRMLIDAAHPEETRVVVLNGTRLEEFDFETSTKKQIKGNIYLAKVTRVEPSLQAAFVEYGGNRHGFLAFNEIHPDYYRIPVADRQAALDAERAAEQAANAREDARERGSAVVEPEPHETESSYDAFGDEHDESTEFQHEAEDGDHQPDDGEHPDHEGQEDDRRDAEPMAHALPIEAVRERAIDDHESGVDDGQDYHAAANGESPLAPYEGEDAPESGEHGEAPVADVSREPSVLVEAHGDSIETVGGDEIEEATRPRVRPFRHYKIQEVIKRRQIMLVQVTKEERGNKGAALTTYLSLAGRYCVLMPNTPRGGGVSRKITSVTDRRRLKDLMGDLEVPEGMGVIVRTAGSERSKPEIKRDFEYLRRLWDEIRDLTLKSTAPALIYEEGSLIKRAIRDLYSRDIDDVVVDGEEAYRAAKDFMRMLMPSHAKRVKLYRDPSVPLLHRHQVETQLDAIHSPTVQLRSGGYIVINPTEALVAIDVNSGRSTKERNIEETALKTNIEAAEEIARQLRLRDLAGLIVIDFIDMEEYRNRGSVERRLKDAMRHDRARIQLGRISPFGLLELSRQRLRPSLVEASTQPCPYCGGTGHIRSIESTALHVLRAIEEEGMRRRSAELAVTVPSKVALYILNQKRAALQQIEGRFAIRVVIGSDDALVPPAFRLERTRALTPAEIAALPQFTPPPPEPEEDEEDGELLILDEEEVEAGAVGETPQRHAEDEDGQGHNRRRRRRHRRPEEGRDAAPRSQAEPRPFAPDEERAEGPSSDGAAEPQPSPHAPPSAARSRDGDDSSADDEHRRRRRGRRGGRRRRREGSPPVEHAAAQAAMGDFARSEGDDHTGAEEFGTEEFVPEEGAPEAETVELVPPSVGHDNGARDTARAFESLPAPPEATLDPASVPVAEAASVPSVAAIAPERAEPANRHNVPPPQDVTGPPANPRRGWWRR